MTGGRGDAPVVSVIMATYRGADLVSETIASVQAQTLAAWELVIVDDGSPDDTLAVLRAHAAGDPRIRVFAAEANRGPVIARNAALAHARGRYIAGLDHDDICLPERLARQVAWLDAHPETVLVATAADLLEDGVVRPGRLPAHMPPALVGWLIRIINPLVWSSVMMRAEAARARDPFTRNDVLYAEDFELYHRMARLGGLARIDTPLLRYRCHADGISKVHEARMLASATRVLAEAYAPLFGAAAADAAGLVIAHIGGGLPIGGEAVLLRLGAILDRLRADYRLTAAPDQHALALIDAETSRLWWQAVRGSVRSGALGLAAARRAARRLAWLRPHGDHADLWISGAIGAARALRAG